MPGSVIYHEDNFGLKEHWKVLAAMTLVSISTFQYGLDFGIIGGLQAMVGFLKVSFSLCSTTAYTTISY